MRLESGVLPFRTPGAALPNGTLGEGFGVRKGVLSTSGL